MGVRSKQELLSDAKCVSGVRVEDSQASQAIATWALVEVLADIRDELRSTLPRILQQLTYRK